MSHSLDVFIPPVHNRDSLERITLWIQHEACRIHIKMTMWNFCFAQNGGRGTRFTSCYVRLLSCVDSLSSHLKPKKTSNIYEAIVFQDSVHQRMKDDDPWKRKIQMRRDSEVPQFTLRESPSMTRRRSLEWAQHTAWVKQVKLKIRCQLTSCWDE